MPLKKAKELAERYKRLTKVKWVVLQHPTENTYLPVPASQIEERLAQGYKTI